MKHRESGMKTRHLAVSALLLMSAALAGCGEPQPQKRRSFLHDNPWVAEKPAERTARKSSPPVKPRPAAYKPVKKIVHPIFEADGKWTVRVAFYRSNPKKKLTALHYANELAKALRKKGEEAYVTDLISLAIVSVGTFDRARDPELTRTWRKYYDGWLALRKGRKSQFRESMEHFYGARTIFGDQPWPVGIIDLQVKMKSAYKIPLTAEDKKRHKKYLKERVRTGENP